jgi:hypothetical protein
MSRRAGPPRRPAAAAIGWRAAATTGGPPPQTAAIRWRGTEATTVGPEATTASPPPSPQTPAAGPPPSPQTPAAASPASRSRLNALLQEATGKQTEAEAVAAKAMAAFEAVRGVSRVTWRLVDGLWDAALGPLDWRFTETKKALSAWARSDAQDGPLPPEARDLEAALSRGPPYEAFALEAATRQFEENVVSVLRDTMIVAYRHVEALEDVQYKLKLVLEHAYEDGQPEQLALRQLSASKKQTTRDQRTPEDPGERPGDTQRALSRGMAAEDGRSNADVLDTLQAYQSTIDNYTDLARDSWVAVEDEDSETVTYYYHNTATGETTWDRPDGVTDPYTQSVIEIVAKAKDMKAKKDQERAQSAEEAKQEEAQRAKRKVAKEATRIQDKLVAAERNSKYSAFLSKVVKAGRSLDATQALKTNIDAEITRQKHRIAKDESKRFEARLEKKRLQNAAANSYAAADRLRFTEFLKIQETDAGAETGYCAKMDLGTHFTVARQIREFQIFPDIFGTTGTGLTPHFTEVAEAQARVYPLQRYRSNEEFESHALTFFSREHHADLLFMLWVLENSQDARDGLGKETTQVQAQFAMYVALCFPFPGTMTLTDGASGTHHHVVGKVKHGLLNGDRRLDTALLIVDPAATTAQGVQDARTFVNFTYDEAHNAAWFNAFEGTNVGVTTPDHLQYLDEASTRGKPSAQKFEALRKTQPPLSAAIARTLQRANAIHEINKTTEAVVVAQQAAVDRMMSEVQRLVPMYVAAAKAQYYDVMHALADQAATCVGIGADNAFVYTRRNGPLKNRVEALRQDFRALSLLLQAVVDALGQDGREAAATATAFVAAWEGLQTATEGLGGQDPPAQYTTPTTFAVHEDFRRLLNYIDDEALERKPRAGPDATWSDLTKTQALLSREMLALASVSQRATTQEEGIARGVLFYLKTALDTLCENIAQTRTTIRIANRWKRRRTDNPWTPLAAPRTDTDDDDDDDARELRARGEHNTAMPMDTPAPGASRGYASDTANDMWQRIDQVRRQLFGDTYINFKDVNLTSDLSKFTDTQPDRVDSDGDSDDDSDGDQSDAADGQPQPEPEPEPSTGGGATLPDRQGPWPAAER